MSQCLNPDCLHTNPTNAKFCQSCRTKLLLVERYRAIKILGQGGFGRTFLAVDELKPSKPKCVIKQLLPQAQGTSNAQKAAELFAQEAEQLEKLGKHPQIPELLAYFTQDEQQYLVQEFIDGDNLAQELAEKGAYNEQQIRGLLKDLLHVLQFVHSKNVIHRDIKPENIIRRRSDSKLVLVDFGAAKAEINSNLSVTGTVIGSAEYTAPEQARGKAKFASDLYSLGVTCIHLLTKVSPFELFDIDEGDWVWRSFLSDNPVSDHLGEVLDKLIEVAPKQRYQETKEVLEMIFLSSLTPKKSISKNVEPLLQIFYDQVDYQSTNAGKLLHHYDFGWHFYVGVSDSHVFGFGGKGFAVFPTPAKAKSVRKIKLFEPKEVLERCVKAYSLFKDWDYGFLGWNCEHFARLIATGEAISYQVKESPLAFLNNGGYNLEAQRMMEKSLSGSFPLKKNSLSGVSPEIEINPATLINLRTNCTDHTKLCNLLAEKKWREADNETRSLMQGITRRGRKGYLNLQSIQNLPSTDLVVMDYLWSHYSNGRFGFTAQSKIWQTVNGDYGKFSNQVSWNRSYNDFFFQEDAPSVAPQGHFPCYWRPLGHFGGTWWWINIHEIGILLSRPEFLTSSQTV